MARPRSDIAPRIVHAAHDRFLKEGVDGASLRAIAQDAGTSIGMVYYYFPTKDDLFLAVVEETYARVLAKMSAALGPAAPVEERIGRLYRTIGELTDPEISTVRLVAREALVSSNRLARLLDRFERGHLPLIAGVLSDGLREGGIDPRVSFPVLIGVTFALGAVPQMMRRVAGDRFGVLFPPPDALAGELVRILFHGISPSDKAVAPSLDKGAAPSSDEAVAPTPDKAVAPLLDEAASPAPDEPATPSPGTDAPAVPRPRRPPRRRR